MTFARTPKVTFESLFRIFEFCGVIRPFIRCNNFTTSKNPLCLVTEWDCVECTKIAHRHSLAIFDRRLGCCRDFRIGHHFPLQRYRFRSLVMVDRREIAHLGGTRNRDFQGAVNWWFPNLVVSNLVVCDFHAEALFCTLLCPFLRSFVRPTAFRTTPLGNFKVKIAAATAEIRVIVGAPCD